MAGKSTSLLKTVEKLKSTSLTMGGVITMRVTENSNSDERKIVKPGSTESFLFCSRTEWDTGIKDDLFRNCNYYFSRYAFEKGNEWIRTGMDSDVLFIDEIGGIEMKKDSEHKWDFTLPLGQPRNKKQVLVFSVRDNLVVDFIEKYNCGWKVLRAEANKDISDNIISQMQDHLL